MINRRNFLKKTIYIATFPTLNSFATTTIQNKQNRFIKLYGTSICPLCSIGCRTVITKRVYKDKVVINNILGDKTANLNHGEICPKIQNLPYEKSSIQHERVQTPLLKMLDGKYHKNGVLTPISWKEAFALMTIKSKEAVNLSGVDGVGVVLSERLSLYESYAISKFYKAGFRSNNISNVHSEVENTSLALIQTFGIDGSNGSFEDIFESDFFISYGIDWRTDFKIIDTKISLQKTIKKEDFIFIHIFSDEKIHNPKADINLQILPFTEPILLSFLINQSLQSFTTESFEFVHTHTIFALLDKTIKPNDDTYSQWEVTLKSYQKHFEKFTLDYVIKKLKPRFEKSEDFKAKLLILALAYKNTNSKILSYLNPKRYDIFTDINLYLDSLHLLNNKYNQKGSGVMRLHSDTITSTQSVHTGNTSARLPMGLFTKYKQFRQKAETIWNIPNNTLNSVGSNDPLIVFKNIDNNITKFVWFMGIETKDFEYIEKNTSKDYEAFTVSSSIYKKDIVPFADLVLPTTTLFEKNIAYENSQRELSCFPQHSIPNNDSMSELWQILEFSKKLHIIDFWDTKLLKEGVVLKSVLPSMQHISFLDQVTLYTMLFHNKRARQYSFVEDKFYDIYYFNTEAKGDLRTILDGDGLVFRGYNFFVQKYLFEELRLFGIGYGYDFDSFESYFNENPKKWPIVFGNGTSIRFDISDDFYAKKSLSKGKKYSFYGKLGKKKLPFGDNINIVKQTKKELKNRAKIFMIKRG
jgi:nitrate reductase (cytochrome)